MNKIKVTVLDKSQHFNAKYISSLTKLTFSQKLNANDDIASKLLDYENCTPAICENICKYNHTSLLEQCWCSMIFEGTSRSFLSQITRARLFSYCSASQHYQNWSDMADFVVPLELMGEDKKDVREEYLASCKRSLDDYRDLIAKGVLPEVARQCTPQGMRNNLIVAGNLRQWCNFLNLRLCNRNTSEIQYVAWLSYNIIKKWIPEAMTLNAVPDCCKLGQCTQGTKCCGEKWSEDKMVERFKIITDITPLNISCHW